MSEIRLVSDGTIEGTNLYIDGNRMGGIQRLVWEFDVAKRLPVIHAEILACTVNPPSEDRKCEVGEIIYGGDEYHIEVEHLSKVYEMGNLDAIGVRRGQPK